MSSNELTERMTSPQAVMDKSPQITGADPETQEQEEDSPQKVQCCTHTPEPSTVPTTVSTTPRRNHANNKIDILFCIHYNV